MNAGFKLFWTASQIRDLLEDNRQKFTLPESLYIFFWFFRGAQNRNDSGLQFIDRATVNQQCMLIFPRIFDHCFHLRFVYFLFVGNDVKTFDQLTNSLFDANHLKIQAFELLMKHLAPIDREYPLRNVKRTSFILTKTIGVVINGHRLGNLLPSQLLRAEIILVKAFKVCGTN